jgi:uncharacterized protein (TIGR02598 family)
MKTHTLIRTRGFSLPEVTLAVGIAALGILAIMGLMPQGLEMSRQIGQITVQRNIVDQFVRDAEQRKLADLPTGTVTKQFDDQGVEVSSGAQANMAAYVAQAEVINEVLLPLGKFTSKQSPEPRLRKMVVKVATSATGNFDFADANSRNYATFVHLLSEN